MGINGPDSGINGPDSGKSYEMPIFSFGMTFQELMERLGFKDYLDGSIKLGEIDFSFKDKDVSIIGQGINSCDFVLDNSVNKLNIISDVFTKKLDLIKALVFQRVLEIINRNKSDESPELTVSYHKHLDTLHAWDSYIENPESNPKLSLSGELEGLEDNSQDVVVINHGLLGSCDRTLLRKAMKKLKIGGHLMIIDNASHIEKKQELQNLLYLISKFYFSKTHKKDIDGTSFWVAEKVK